MNVADWSVLWPPRCAINEWRSVESNVLSKGGPLNIDTSDELNVIQSKSSFIQFPYPHVPLSKLQWSNGGHDPSSNSRSSMAMTDVFCVPTEP